MSKSIQQYHCLRQRKQTTTPKTPFFHHRKSQNLFFHNHKQTIHPPHLSKISKSTNKNITMNTITYKIFQHFNLFRRRQSAVAPQDSILAKSDFRIKSSLPELEHKDSENHSRIPTTTTQQTGPGARSWRGAWGRAVPKKTLSLSPYHLTVIGVPSPLAEKQKLSSGWFPLAAFGNYYHTKGIYRLTEDEAKEIIHHFYCIQSKILRLFRKFPILTQHPRLIHQISQPCGYIKDLKIRNKSLWVSIEWNSFGQKILKEQFNGTLIPIWALRKLEFDIFTPFKLLQVQLSFPPQLPPPSPTIITFPKQPLNTISITNHLATNNPMQNNYDHILAKVHNHMEKTGQHYLQSWNAIKHEHSNLSSR